jgi:hypothetical protein
MDSVPLAPIAPAHKECLKADSVHLSLSHAVAALAAHPREALGWGWPDTLKTSCSASFPHSALTPRRKGVVEGKPFNLFLRPRKLRASLSFEFALQD